MTGEPIQEARSGSHSKVLPGPGQSPGLWLCLLPMTNAPGEPCGEDSQGGRMKCSSSMHPSCWSGCVSSFTETTLLTSSVYLKGNRLEIVFIVYFKKYHHSWLWFGEWSAGGGGASLAGRYVHAFWGWGSRGEAVLIRRSWSGSRWAQTPAPPAASSVAMFAV